MKREIDRYGFGEFEDQWWFGLKQYEEVYSEKIECCTLGLDVVKYIRIHFRDWVDHRIFDAGAYLYGMKIKISNDYGKSGMLLHSGDGSNSILMEFYLESRINLNWDDPCKKELEKIDKNIKELEDLDLVHMFGMERKPKTRMQRWAKRWLEKSNKKEYMLSDDWNGGLECNMEV